MKYHFLTLCFFITLTVFINGCKKDGEDAKQNGFTYKGVFYDAQLFGVEILYGGNYDLRVEISNGTSWDEANNHVVGDDYTMIRLNTVNIIDGNTLGTGTYFHSASSTEQGIIYGGYESFCFKGGENGNCVESPDVVGGNMKVSKSGNIYTLEYSLTLSNGESLEGYYSGELDYVHED